MALAEPDEAARTRALAEAFAASLRLNGAPDVGIVLGSGLEAVADALLDHRSVPATSLDGFPPPGVHGHAASVHAGRMGDAGVLITAGRVHLYEGHSVDIVTRPVRALAALGTRAIILTNTAGGTRGSLQPGTILAVREVFHWMGAALGRRTGTGAAEGLEGAGRRPRLPGALEMEAEMAHAAHVRARELAVNLVPGVLAAGLGPCYETAGEVAMLRRLGADALTMSTVPEFLAARRAGIPVMVFTVITNHATGILSGAHLTHAEVVERGARATEALVGIIGAAAARVASRPAPSSVHPRPHRPTPDS